MTTGGRALAGDAIRGGMREHPARREVVGEMHLRRWPELVAPGLIIHWLRIADEEQKAGQREALLSVPQAAGFEQRSGLRHLWGVLSDGVRFAWECHSEASSLTFFIAADDPMLLRHPERLSTLSEAVAMAEGLPGEIVRATRMWIAADEDAAGRAMAVMDFVGEELVSCLVGDGARLWSDFRIKQNGYGHVLVSAGVLTAGDLSRVLQRLQELGNYRNLALLGLPVAQHYWPRLDRAEEELRAIARDQVRAEVRDDDLLARTSELSLELMSLATDASYRMSATAAYARLVEERLAELAVVPIRGFPSLVDFTQRRFLPAVRTCAAFSGREDGLSVRAAQLTSLLRARIETRIENQNAQLLASMERSSALQLRLQQLVEGLSVVAVSYYALGLLDKLLGGLEGVLPGMSGKAATAVLVVPVLLLTLLALRLMKKRVLH